MLKKSLIAKTQGECSYSQVVTGKGYRITVLTNRLFRIEISESNIFTDNATQAVWFRYFPDVIFSVKKDGKNIRIVTNMVELSFDTLLMEVNYIKFLGSGKKVPCSDGGALKGTRRTLDQTFGAVPLGNGIISKNGVSVVDDSKTFILLKNGEIAKRKCEETDYYIFAYAHDYRSCMKDFYKITGNVPIIPRFALGVWWSRYHRYTQDEYIELINRFEKEDIPLTVATVDMDWHWTDLKKQFGKNYISKATLHSPFMPGWTGYSWNTELFPDYKEFLKYLHSKNLKVTLNLHPASGIRSFETMYPQMARAMGIDPNSKKDIPFETGNTKFWNNYFDIVHKPYEKDGVDFWWLDWQQGSKWDVKDLDPLWPLNHYHYLDNGENGQIPLTLSRYAGVGSHRYPLGFSGDTAINWKVLNFQPYFTATAANAGYTWWSHDIGGHCFGKRDDDLYLRWLQFGVFSPILRLHSTSSDLLGKEPWRYRSDVCSSAKDYLRLRHRLIPYIYTCDYRTHKQARALVEPMYYSYPEDENAYKFKNEYFFGSEVIAAPITTPQSKSTNLGAVDVWLPDGRWTDIFTGRIYHGSKVIKMHRDLSSIPVLAKEGAIIPLSDDGGNSISNPNSLCILVYRGNNDFELYEDNGRMDYENHNAKTKLSVSEDSSVKFEISPASGDLSILPKTRNYLLKFKDICHAEKISIRIDGKAKKFPVKQNNGIEIELNDIPISSNIKIIISQYRVAENPDFKDGVVNVFSRWQNSTGIKAIAYSPFKTIKSKNELKKLISVSILPSDIKSALKEYTED